MSLHKFCSILVQYIGNSFQKTRRMKRKRIEEKDCEGQTSENTERKRIKEERDCEGQTSENTERKRVKEEMTLKMALAVKKTWTSGEKSLFLALLVDYSNQALDQHLTSHDYWNATFWKELCNVYNRRAIDRGFDQIPPYELILQGGCFQSEFCKQRSMGQHIVSPTLQNIFSICEPCQRKVPVFPKSLLLQLGYAPSAPSRSGNRYEVGSRSGSGSASGTGSASGARYRAAGASGARYEAAGASVENAGQSRSVTPVLNLISDFEQEGEITLSQAISLIEKVNTWFKDDHVGWTTLLLDGVLSREGKLRYLKGILDLV